MSTVTQFPRPAEVDSTEAISARAKEKIRMQATRYQRGSLSLVKRKSQPDVWVFRYYAEEDGRRAYKKKIVGTVVEFPKRKDAEKAVSQFRVDVNEGAAFAPMNLEQLVAHYQNVELPLKALLYRGGVQELLQSPHPAEVGETQLIGDQERRSRSMASALEEGEREARKSWHTNQNSEHHVRALLSCNSV